MATTVAGGKTSDPGYIQQCERSRTRTDIFDTLWNVAIPAEQKIREIRRKIIHETRIIENNPDEIVRQLSRQTADSTELAICLTPLGMQYSQLFFRHKEEHNG